MNRLQTWVIAGSCLVSAVFAGYLADAIAPAVEYRDGVAPKVMRGDRRFLAMTLLGQFRVTVNKYFWLRTEDYLHFGIMHNAYTRQKFQQDMNHESLSAWGRFRNGGKNSTPRPKQKDWRGIFKRFDYIQPVKGYHGNPSELLPWYRMQTVVNPNDTSAYVNGAFFLADFNNKLDEALAFLHEGIVNNPESPEINLAIGRLYIEKWKKYDEAIPYLEKAVAFGREIKNRNLSQDRTVGNSYVFLVDAYRKTGDLESALRVAEDGLKICPNYALVRTSYRLVKKDIEKEKTR
jgi:tetratricopeptide (TPR) repeat protein